MSDLVPVAKIVKLPDGRWAVENGQGVAELTREDVSQIITAFSIWMELLFARRGWAP